MNEHGMKKHCYFVFSYWWLPGDHNIHWVHSLATLSGWELFIYFFFQGKKNVPWDNQCILWLGNQGSVEWNENQNPIWWLLARFPAASQVLVSPLSSLVLILNCLFPPGKEYQHLLAPCGRNTQVSHPALWHLSFPGVSTEIAAQAL